MLKRLWRTLLVLALLAAPMVPGLPVAPIWAQPGGNVTFWWFQLQDERGQPLTAAATCAIYTAGGDTLATIYSDRNLSTAASNPITAAALFNAPGNSCSFYTANSVTSVDVIAWSKRGRSRLSGYTPTGSRAGVIILNQQMNTKIIQIPFSAGPASSGTSYTNTGVTIPKGFMVRDALVEVRVVGVAPAHLVAGILETDPKGFCASGVTKVGDSTGGITMASLGWLPCIAKFTASSVPAFDKYVSAFHSGALLSTGSVGVDVGTHAGVYFRTPFVGDGTNKTVVYHMGSGVGKNCSQSAACGSGFFYLVGEELGNDY